MTATVEISMYALTDSYEKKIINFISRIKKNKNIRVEVNGLSTQLFGEYNLLIDILKTEMHKDFENGRCVFLLKIASGERTKEKLPKVLK